MPRPTDAIPRSATRSRRAFTLVEAVLAMGLSAILLLGMAAALRASVSGADTGADANARAVAAQSGLEQIRAELNTATAVTSLTPGLIAFTVPDRDADGQPESIQYAWSGTAGAPLTRSFNGSTTDWIADVRSLSITEVVRSAPVTTEGAETTLASCDFTLPASLVEARIGTSNAAAVFFRITPPEGAQSWRLTRFRVSLRRETLLLTSATVTATLYAADSTGRPTGSAIAARTATVSGLLSSTLPDTVEFTFNAAGLSPSSGYCIALTGSAPAVARATMRSTGGAFNTHLMTSTNAGSTWSAPNDSDELRFQVLGTVTTLREVD